jgi:hypothetical protein
LEKYLHSVRIRPGQRNTAVEYMLMMSPYWRAHWRILKFSDRHYAAMSEQRGQ